MHLELLQASQTPQVIFWYVAQIVSVKQKVNQVLSCQHSGWRRKSPLSWWRAPTIRSRGTASLRPGCALTRTTWSWRTRTNSSSCLVWILPFDHMYCFQLETGVTSFGLDPGENWHTKKTGLSHVWPQCWNLFPLRRYFQSQPDATCFVTPVFSCSGKLLFCNSIRKLWGVCLTCCGSSLKVLLGTVMAELTFGMKPFSCLWFRAQISFGSSHECLLIPHHILYMKLPALLILLLLVLLVICSMNVSLSIRVSACVWGTRQWPGPGEDYRCSQPRQQTDPAQSGSSGVCV